MNANKQDAGGLPALPEPACQRDPWPCSQGDGEFLYTADQMRAYGEQCRAAPAGGEDARLSNQDDYTVVDCPRCGTCVQFVRKEAQSLRPQDSAPAGSGEVERMAKRLDDAREIEEETSGLEDTIDAMRTAAALLRKLQQGAECSPNSVAKRKRVEIEALGYVCNGVSFMHPETGRRGLLDDLGAVHWIASQGQEGGK